MSRSGIVTTDDSLELLLDTICNTFGAVVFISILASVLAQNSAPRPVTPEETDVAIEVTFAQQRKLAELQQQTALLETQLQQQENLLERFSSPEALTLAQQLLQDTTSHAELTAQKTQAVEAMVLTERQQLELERILQNQLSQIEQRQQEQQDAENDLRNLDTLEGHTAEVRRVHETTKFGFTFALDNGRLYAVHVSDDSRSDLMSISINRNHCTVTEVAGTTTIRPIANGGILLRDAADAEQLARSELQVVNQRFIIRLFVARDSFAEYLPVKEAMVDLGLEYSIEVMEGDDVELTLTDRVQERTFVQ